MIVILVLSFEFLKSVLPEAVGKRLLTAKWKNQLSIKVGALFSLLLSTPSAPSILPLWIMSSH